MKKSKLMAGTAAVLAIFALLASPALAQDAGVPYNQRPVPDQGGIYLGGFGGWGWTDMDAAGGANVDGMDWGVFGGYKMTGLLSEWNMTAALEVHAAWSDADDAGGGFAYDKDHEWGFSFRPGIKFLSDVAPFDLNPYGILGYRNASIDNTVVGADDDFHGFELGLGTELIAYGNWGVRLDYAHVWYGSEGTMEPDEDDLRLGLAYHFN